MASLSTDAAGYRTVQFVAADGKRRSVRLGKVNKKLAEGVRLKVEALAAAAARSGLPLDGETAAWVGRVGDELHDRLHAVGLVAARQSDTLGAFLDAYLARRRADAKGGTLTNLDIAARDVRRFFGDDSPLRAVTEQRADDFRTHYLTLDPPLAPATTSRRLRTVRQFFGHAVRVKALPANPFAATAIASVLPDDRRRYVGVDDTARLMAVCDPTWRLIVALARYAGLRCPSEVLLLRWEHVNFAAGRMTVLSPKTEHHEGKGSRVVPIFPALRPHLDEAFELAAAGAEHVVPGAYRLASRKADGWKSSNLRTRMLRLVRRAALPVWPKPFQALRASLETDLMQDHPIHVVCAWLGNTPAVALRHYLQVRDTDFDKALAGPGGKRCSIRFRLGRTAPDRKLRPQPVEGVGFSPSGSEWVGYSPNGGVTRLGFEPRIAEPKSAVLPLHHRVVPTRAS